MGRRKSRITLITLLDGPCQGFKVSPGPDGRIICPAMGLGWEREMHLYERTGPDELTALWVRSLGMMQTPMPAGTPGPEKDAAVGPASIPAP